MSIPSMIGLGLAVVAIVMRLVQMVQYTGPLIQHVQFSQILSCVFIREIDMHQNSLFARLITLKQARTP